jgi:hypothetical protein
VAPPALTFRQVTVHLLRTIDQYGHNAVGYISTSPTSDVRAWMHHGHKSHSRNGNLLSVGFGSRNNVSVRSEFCFFGKQPHDMSYRMEKNLAKPIRPVAFIIDQEPLNCFCRLMKESLYHRVKLTLDFARIRVRKVPEFSFPHIVQKGSRAHPTF